MLLLMLDGNRRVLPRHLNSVVMADTSSKMDTDEKTSGKASEAAAAQAGTSTDAVVVEVRGANGVTCRLITRSSYIVAVVLRARWRVRLTARARAGRQQARPVRPPARAGARASARAGRAAAHQGLRWAAECSARAMG